jgi:uncharacterized membrane protein YjgN (DUF898 family)
LDDIAATKGQSMVQIEAKNAPAEGFVWLWRPGLIALVLRNAALLICTGGLHRFWGVAAWRRHVWSRVALRGDPLEFVGTGLDGFKGFLVAAAVLVPVLAASAFLADVVAAGRPEARPLALAARAVPLLALLGAWRFFRLRYLLSRTRWRGVAPALDAGFGDYLRFALPLFAINALALGLATPWVWQRRQAWLIARMRLGDATFSGTPDWQPLMLPWLCVWCAAVAGLAWTLAQPLALAPLPARPSSGIAAGWLPVVALVAGLLAFGAYRMAAWRSFAGSLRLGRATLASAARPGFAATRLALAGLLLGALLVAGGILIAMLSGLLRPLPAIVQHVLSAGVALVSLMLTRDAFLAPAAIAHAVATLEISGGEALDAIAASAPAGQPRAPMDVGPG